MLLYLYVLIVFSLHRESLKLILINEPLPEMVISHKLAIVDKNLSTTAQDGPS
jgi:hypothetical protein